MTDNNEGLTEYVGGGLQSVAWSLAVAWPLLSEIEEDTSYHTGYYVDPEYIKTTRRILRGWAETHKRPGHWPWNHERLNIFKWGDALVIDGEARDSDRHALEAGG